MKRRIRPSLALLGLLLVIACAHGVTLWFPLQFDDINQLRDNPNLRQPGDLIRVWTDPWIGFASGHSASYRPLLYSSFVIEALVGQDAVPVRRAVSLALFACFCLLAWRFSHRLFVRVFSLEQGVAERAAWFTALLVAAHPIYAQSLLLVSARSSLLAGCFILLALLTLLADKPGPGTGARLALYTLLACLSKESGVMALPFAMLLLLATTRDWRALAAFKPIVPILAVVLGYLAFHRYVFLAEMVGAGAPVPAPASLLKQALPQPDYAAQGGIYLLQFLRLLVVPWGLSPVQPAPVMTPLLLVVGWAVWPLLTGLCALAWWRGGVAWRLPAFAGLWFVAGLFPVLALVKLNIPFSEHRAVLAVVPLLAVLGWALARLQGRTPHLALAGLVALYTLAGNIQQWPWRDAVALWSWQAERVPESSRAWSFLAGALVEAGRRQEAREANLRAMTLAPRNPSYLVQRAHIAWLDGESELAASLANRAVGMEPNLFVAHLILTEWHALAGRIGQALHHARRATELDPDSSEAWNSLGNVHYLAGTPDRAATAYRKALELDRGNAQARSNLDLVAPAPGTSGARP